MKKKLTLLLLLLTPYFFYAQCFRSVYAGEFSNMAIASNGSLWGWGSNLNHNLGFVSTNPESIEPTPVQIGTDLDWKILSLGSAHTLAIKNNGTLWSWGSNAFGQLGNSTNTDLVSPTQIGTETNWKSISTGEFSSYAIKNDGTLWAWGKNNFGQLALGNNNNYNSPNQVGSDSDWKLVDGGGLHVFAIKNNGTLWSSGDNRYGELGLGTISVGGPTNDQNTLTQIGTDSDWKTVSCISYHVLGLKNNKTMWGWGANTAWSLGMPNTAPFPFYVLIPTQIGTDTDWKEIAAAEHHSLALKNDGTMWSAGSNYFGTLGDGLGGFAIFNQVFTQNSSEIWSSIATGLYHSVGFKPNGNVYTWGENKYGTKGNGIIDPYSFPEDPYTGPENYTPYQVVCPPTLSNNEFNSLSVVDLSIYPNPVLETINITYTALNKISNISIYDNLGKEIIKINNEVNQINVKNLEAGIYFISFSINNQTINKKFIKN